MSEKESVRNYVSGTVNSLSVRRETNDGRAMLARLRRGIGKTPGELPELWGVFLNELPEELMSKSGVPTKAEWAVYISLTLFALHQQGNNEPVSQNGISVGKAASMLADEKKDEEIERIMHRFGPVVTAKDMPELSHHLRGLVNLFKSKGIRLDYPKLAEDIYEFQFPDSRKRVQLRWGQDFYYTEKADATDIKDNKGEDNQ